jgi:hypothetical protein
MSGDAKGHDGEAAAMAAPLTPVRVCSLARLPPGRVNARYAA